MSQSYDIVNPIPNKMLQEDGSITTMDGSILSSGTPERAEWYNIMNPIPNKTLNPNGSITLLSDALGGGTGGGSSILSPSFDKVVDIDYTKEIIIEQWLDQPLSFMTVGGYIYHDKEYDPLNQTSRGLSAIGTFEVNTSDDGQGGITGYVQAPMGVMFMQGVDLTLVTPIEEERRRVAWKLIFPQLDQNIYNFTLKMYYMGKDTTITQL